MAAAEPRNQLWRLALGLVLIPILWLLPIIIGVFAFSLFTNPDALTAFAGNNVPESPLATLVFIGLFVFAFPALWFVSRQLHARSMASLIGPGGIFDWRGFRLAVTVIGAYVVVGFVVAIASGSAMANLDFSRWILLLPVSVPLIFVQTSAEELVFRGYLMQQLGARFTSRWIWWVLPAAVFASLHWNPSVFAENAPFVVLATFLMGLIAGDVTARTGNLGTSIGLHFANNVYAILIMGLPGPLSGVALYLADVDMSDIAEVRAELLFQTTVILVLYAVYLAIVARRRS